jgi:hypothetical protein
MATITIPLAPFVENIESDDMAPPPPPPELGNAGDALTSILGGL